MASELEEEIIIIEEGDLANESASAKKSSSGSKKIFLPDKKKIIIAGIGLFLIILLIVLTIVLLKQKKTTTPNIASTQQIEEKLENSTEVIEPSKLENMIAKADYLYSNGSKNEALLLYEKIAQHSEAVSAYNLGVAQLKDGQYENALGNFQRAIHNNENRCVSAINAAVCSLHLNNKESFNYYIDLAHAFLPYENQSPLYSYYYTLVNYYKGNYYEALSSLNNPTTNEYSNIQNNLSAKINALFKNDYKAIEVLEKNTQLENDFALGLLYARIGDLALAKDYLQNSIKNNTEPVKSQVALGYVYLKAGQIQDAAKEIENVTDMFGEEAYKPYPIKVFLKSSLFEPDEAQTKYRDIISKSKSANYQKIFYFSPYKTFNANQTINYIRKGTANIFVENIASAQGYLQESVASSSVNKEIVRAIQKALSFKLRDANEILQKLVDVQPKHSVLHYNLALTYAQLDNMSEAHKHFLRSYNLDAKNYLSGIYAVMTAQLIDKDSSKLLSILKDAISHEEKSEDIELYTTLLHLSEDDTFATSDWIEREYKQTPLYLALDTIIALKLNNADLAQKASKKLSILLPDEIVPHIMYIDAHFKDLKTKEYAKEVLNYLKVQNFDFNDLYFGPSVVRYLYIQQNLITGKLFFLKKQLEAVLESTTESTKELTSALALTSLYNKDFEESFMHYNNLIDNLKVKDTQTLFLGAVASTAANHHANAIALLELSKMRDFTFLESRYALGLLYLESKNNEGALIQFYKIAKNNFNTQFFDFGIDSEKLLFEKNQAEEKN
ncbi:MAG: hypothetical protein QG559_38 [Campylobacterota bacterium]|nr:hypothetical protein [Campylobacterota bacterium]